MCEWPSYLPKGVTPPYGDIAEYCNSWRNFDDVQDSWASVAYIVDWLVYWRRVGIVVIVGRVGGRGEG